MSVFIQAAPQKVAEFNGTSSKVSASPVISGNFQNFSIECDFVLLADSSASVSDETYIYSESTNATGKALRFIVYEFGGVVVLAKESNSNFDSVSGTYSGGFVIGQSYNLKYELTTTGNNNFDVELFIDGTSVNTGTLMNVTWAADVAEIGEIVGFSSRKFSLSNLKINQGGVLVRDLPLNGSATDATGNSSPVATDVTFSTLPGGYIPTQPLNHPRIGYTNVLSASNSTGTAVAGFPLSNAFIEQTYEFFKPSGTDSTVLIDLGSAQDVNYFGLVGRNMGAVRLESSTDNTTFTTVLDATDSGNVITMGLFATVTAQYFKFTFFGSTQEIIKLNLGTTLEMTKPISQSFTPVSMGKQETYKTNMSEGGQFIGRTIKRSGFNSSYTFDYLAPSFYRSSVAPFIDHAAIKPFFVAWCPSLHAAEVGYCYTRSRPIPEYMGFSDYMMVALELQGFDVESGQ